MFGAGAVKLPVCALYHKADKPFCSRSSQKYPSACTQLFFNFLYGGFHVFIGKRFFLIRNAKIYKQLRVKFKRFAKL